MLVTYLMLDELAARRAARSTATVIDARAILDVLAEVSAAFVSQRLLDPLLDRLLETALGLVCAEAGSIMLLSPERDTLVVVAARGPRARKILGTCQPAVGSIDGWPARPGQTAALHDDAQVEPDSGRPRAPRSFVAAPLALAGRLVGVINASPQQGAPQLNGDAAHLLELVANQAAILIDSFQMVDQLQRNDQRLEQLVDQLLVESDRRPGTSLAQLPPLTRREQQVLELLVDGLTNRGIALRLVVEPDTIKDHVQSIIKKLGATDRTHAAVIAIRRGIVS